MSEFSSRDFGRTQAQIKVELPERLIHKDVEHSGLDARFSGERKHLVQVVDLPSKTLSITLGGLDPLQTTNSHRHTYETIIFILEGEGQTRIEDRSISWKAGDAVYIPVWAWHSHQNCSPVKACRYLACENAPLLQNIGGVAIREEASDVP